MVRECEVAAAAETVTTTTEQVKLKKPLSHFVFIHGFSHGAWCWYKVRSLMENSGYKVTCLDLKGAGIDRTDADSVLTFQDYNKPLIDFLSTLPDDEQVILVGHSAGGLSVTDASYRFPKKVRLAVYLAATMLKKGFKSEQDTKNGSPDLSEYGELDDVYDVRYSLGPEHSPTSLTIRKCLQRKLLYQMSPLEDSTLATMLLRPGPIQALQSVQFEDKEVDIDRTPARVYIRTMYDRILKPEQQDVMIKRWLPTKVYVMETDHSPFFSDPFLLVGLLVKAATSMGLSWM